MAQEANKQTLGSIYLNAPKGSAQKVYNDLHQVFKWLQDNKIYFGISLSRGKLDGIDENDNGYLNFVGFPNSYKKASSDKVSHYYVVPKSLPEKAQAKKPAYKKPVKEVEEEAAPSDNRNSLPF